MDEQLTLELPNFEGPMDLLLHLIRSQKIDIYDIPIAQITSQYLGYLTKMQQLNLEIAGEYFVMASNLLRIKSASLLPQNDFVEQEEEPVDPREELTQKLITYSVFQKVADYLKEREEFAPLTVAKEPSVSNVKHVQPLALGEISASELANTFSLIMRKFNLKQDQTTINVKEVPVQQMVDQINQSLAEQDQVSFFELAMHLKSVGQVIGLFLAVLEMCKNQLIIVSQARIDGDLSLEKRHNDGK